MYNYNKMNKVITEEYIELTNKKFKYHKKLAIFDIDDTIIETKSGAKFAKDENDWKIKFTNLIRILNSLKEQKFSIIFISNQKGLNDIDKINKWIIKINNLQKLINLNIKVFASLGDNIYRKPNIGFFELIKNNSDKRIKMSESFYIGDAAGRKDDFSDSDIKFALNCSLKFMLPEIFFDEINFNPSLFLDNKLDIPKNIKDKVLPPKNINILELNANIKTMIIMVGMPGCGKSSLSNKLDNYVRINMDSLKTMNKCLTMCESLLKTNQNIIIDNTNPDKKSRSKYIELAKTYNYKIIIIKFETTEEICKHNIKYRLIKGGANIPEIVFRVYKKYYEEPTDDEGEIISYLPNYLENKDELYYKYY